MEFPKNLTYAKTHEWLKKDGDLVEIGLTDYAQDQLGDIVFIDVTTEGETLDKGEVFGTVEVVKTVSDLFLPIGGEILEVNPQLEESPVTGVVAEINEALLDAPESVNGAPYDAWFIKVKDVTEEEDLLDADAYEALCQEGGEA